ncbi:MAG: glycosyltransferase family 39 protein [Pseudomonadota bacterium]|nr:glycosyltransferase family 39 protein [Pseudomonadota bacterium]
MPAVNATSESASGSTLPGAWTGADRLVLACLVLVAVLRSLAIILSPLELGVDEAQYWLWSTTFDFGYYTKPPLTSWIIGVSHGLFGHHVWSVRLPAPWLHLGTALILWRAGFWHAGRGAGRWAALLWTLLPAVSLGGFVMSTDTPLLLFWSLGLLALVGGVTGRIAMNRSMALAGAAFGGALLGKYAAIYGLVGLLLFWASDRIAGDRRVTATSLAAFVIAMAIAASPNLLWNLMHDFTTVRHLGDNANLDRQSHDPLNSLRFLGAQFATAGPLVFTLMFGILKGGRDPATRLLMCLSLPVIAIIMVQAFLSEANANWALAAMPALVVWLAGWLAGRASSPTRTRVGSAALAINAGLAIAILMVTFTGSLGPLTPDSDPLRRQRGWHQLASDSAAALARHDATTIIADRRASAALLSWHFHGTGIDVLVHDRDGVPSNHFEQNLAWTHQPGRRLVVLGDDAGAPAMAGVDWISTPPPRASSATISHNRTRRVYLHQGVETD